MEESVYLRTLEPGDLERVYQWHNDQELYRNLIGVHHFVSRATVEKWLAKKSEYSNTEVNLAICLKEENQHIGNIYLQNIDWVSRTGALGIFIGEIDLRKKGYGQAAMRLMIKYAFLTIGLNRIHTTLFENNKQSLNLFQKSGFSIEGTLRNHIYQEGRYWNVLFMGLCREEWKQ